MTINRLRKLTNMSIDDLASKRQDLELTIEQAHKENACNYFGLLELYWDVRNELDRRAN
jgi:hypothetical protein